MQLASVVNQLPEALVFAYGPHGKPSLVGHEEVGFNLSHSNECALFAVAVGRVVGIDIERVRPIDAVALSRRFFSPHESTIIASLSGPAQHAAFFTAWTRKEAFLKATGEGIGALSTIEVSLLPDEEPRLIHPHADQWRIEAVEVGASGYMAAVVVSAKSD